ncbi:MAG: hypothetical protein JWM36_3020 [Hyphomicrobiales bacterium]|nr:hypothetical protein [Hyphomicrobiales bacterium]
MLGAEIDAQAIITGKLRYLPIVGEELTAHMGLALRRWRSTFFLKND